MQTDLSAGQTEQKEKVLQRFNVQKFCQCEACIEKLLRFNFSIIPYMAIKAPCAYLDTTTMAINLILIVIYSFLATKVQEN